MVSFIVGIVSVVLAVVSLIFSTVFYKWGKKQNDLTSHLTIKIEEKVLCLEKLFDKMYDSTYQIVRENNLAMQRHLFKGTFESQTIVNKDMDVFLLLDSKKHVTKAEICKELDITRTVVDDIINRMVSKGKATIDTDGETVNVVESHYVESLGSSEDNLDETQTA